MQSKAKLVDAFKRLRSNDAVPGSGSVYRITVRQLEALVRLSEALARLSFRREVSPEDVVEAQRLIKASVHSAGDSDMVLDHMADSDAVDAADVNHMLSEVGLGEAGMPCFQLLYILITLNTTVSSILTTLNTILACILISLNTVFNFVGML